MALITRLGEAEVRVPGLEAQLAASQEYAVRLEDELQKKADRLAHAAEAEHGFRNKKFLKKAFP